MDYPPRPPFFAMRFLRLLAKSAAAMHIGADGCYLLALIVGQEDACRYLRPVSYWNHQLATLMGLRGSDEHGLRRVRERCVRAGWLQYRAGNKQQPAAYFVTIPAAVNLLPDGACDESPREYRANNASIPQERRRESGENQAGIRRESAENPAPFSPSPSPSPAPKDTTTSSAALSQRISMQDPKRISAAIWAVDYMALLGAYGANTARNMEEWGKEAHDLQIGVLAAILEWRLSLHDAIREPSGLRAAREAWAELETTERQRMAQAVSRHMAAR